MNCTRCENSGFINIGQLPDKVCIEFDETGDHSVISRWMLENIDQDVQVCDCCGDGKGWYGTPGEHSSDDPCECD